MEHNGKVIGESLDLIKYVDSNFEGPYLLPNVRFDNSLCHSLTLLEFDKSYDVSVGSC